MNSTLQASKVFVKKQCVRTSFAAKRSFISFSPTSPQKGVTSNNKIGLSNTAICFQQKKFSTDEKKKDDLVLAESLLKGPPSEKVQQLCTDILSLNIVDIHVLLDLIQKKLGISEETMNSMIGGGGGGGGGGGAAAAVAAEPVKEKEAFDIKLTVVDPKSKIKIIKEVRALTGLGLKEAKDLVEKAPVVIKEGVKKEELDAIKKTLTDAGAQIEII